jgi:hypothetical protein
MKRGFLQLEVAHAWGSYHLGARQASQKVPWVTHEMSPSPGTLICLSFNLVLDHI